MKKEWTPYIIYMIIFVCIAAFPYKYFYGPDYPLGAFAILWMTAWISAFVISLIIGIVQPSLNKWLFVPYVCITGFVYDLLYHGADRLVNDPPNPVMLLGLSSIAAFIGMGSGSLIRIIRCKYSKETERKS